MTKPNIYYNDFDGGDHDLNNLGERKEEIYDGMVIKDNIGDYGEIKIEIKGDKIFAKNNKGKNIFLNGITYFGDENRPYFTKKDGITVLAVDLPGVNRYFLEDGSIYSSYSKVDRVISGTKNIIKKFTKN